MRKNIFTVYGAAALALVLLIAVAFLSPEIAFNMQDGIRCQQVVSVTRENLDIASFNTGYETDLCRRLTRFAEGLAEGEQYYVTVQEIDLTSQTTTLSDFDKIAHSDSLELLMMWNPWDLNILLRVVYNAEVTCWKQCVIYGDDFAGGVNFILWYLELSGEGIPDVKLLVDGETGELYGFRSDSGVNSKVLTTEGISDDAAEKLLTERYYGMREMFEYPSNIWEACVIFGAQFGGLDIAGRLYWLEEIGYYYEFVETEEGEEGEEMMRVVRLNTEVQTDGEEGVEENGYRLAEIEDFLDRLRWTADEGNKCLNFTYPFGKGELNLRFQLGSEIVGAGGNGILYLNEIFGFPEIYELIPEFMEK